MSQYAEQVLNRKCAGWDDTLSLGPDLPTHNINKRKRRLFLQLYLFNLEITLA